MQKFVFTLFNGSVICSHELPKMVDFHSRVFFFSLRKMLNLRPSQIKIYIYFFSRQIKIYLFCGFVGNIVGLSVDIGILALIEFYGSTPPPCFFNAMR